MPRSLVLGNGHLLATFDEYLQLRDLYYPYVGMEDHTSYGHFHRIGFWVEGKFSWLNDGNWKIVVKYQKNTLVGDSIALNEQLGLKVLFEDFVYTTSPILFRKLTITNLSDHDREIRVFFCHDLHLYGEKMQDTAQYEPEFNGVLHYRKNRYFLIGGKWEEGNGIDQFSMGKSEYLDKEGTFRDCEDGRLEGNPIEQGSVDSAVRFSSTFTPGAEKVLFHWLIAGEKYEDIHFLHERITALTPQSIMAHTAQFWEKWSQKEHFEFKGVPEKLSDLFYRSLLIVATQTDSGGAIIAANDSDIMKFNKDTYTYMWPRDGALIATAMSEAGYEAIVRDFLFFCRKLITKEGFVLHKYNPDGSLGSSWHPKWRDGEVQLPIQEDESALILVAMRKYYEAFQNIEVIQKLFNEIVLQIGRWLIAYTDKKTGLPLPSYDLWEEQRGVFTYTAACAYAGLEAAAFLSAETGHANDAQIFSKQAKKLQKAICTYLYSPEHERFVKKVVLENGEITGKDPTVDASLAFLWKMGVLPADDPRIQSTMKAIQTSLHIPTVIGGFARYQGDNYHFDFSGMARSEIPGNPWIITTLWMAEYEMLLAQNREDLAKPLEKLIWVSDRANSAGILPEQVHPLNGQPLSVAPLTWSHGGFVSAILLFEKRWRELGKCKVTIQCE